jgi:hypothetical protein
MRSRVSAAFAAGGRPGPLLAVCGIVNILPYDIKGLRGTPALK